MTIKLQIDIVGPSPNEVDVDELISILEDLRKAISACLPENNAAHGNQIDARVSLVDIVEGSDGLVMEVQPRAAHAIGQISRALRTRSFDDLPQSAHAALFRINQFVTRRKWGMRVRRNDAAGIEAVEVIAPDHVSPPEYRKTISGGTTLMARCLRVGGATTPRAELRLSNRRLLHVEVTESVARELGKRLYDQVVLSGEAVWDAGDGELKEFSVHDVSAFKSVPVDIAFRELATASHGRWDGVDAESFVSHVRETAG